ncbi:N-acetylgalactosamine 4-sulfate 6-O-sulfotransferase [Aureococcus anophagefferens]|nr:N-acetylgalactosamine 4-sulfate 6-O-sulfotransferase [Aureococcus anophagefferens]
MAAMLEAEILAAEIEAAGSGEMMPADALVVVETVYPRPYLGRAWTREELLHQSQVTVHGPYATVAAAVEQARDVRDGCGRFPPRTAATGPPPWDSGAEAGDRDADTSVEVLDERAYAARRDGDAAALRRARARDVFARRVAAEMRGAQVRAAGRVHYSDPPEAYDIRADLDVDAAAARELEEAAVEAAATLRFAVGAATPPGEAAAALVALVARCGALAELHYDGRSAPRGAADACGLERLDVSDCFSSEFFDHEADPPVYPYDAPLAACFERLPRLRYVDFGHGDDDALATFWGYCFSQDRVEALRERFPAVECSMAEAKHSPLPHPFPGGSLAHEEALFDIVGRLGEDGDPAVRGAPPDFDHADDHRVDLASLSLDDQRDVEVDYNDSYGESGESDSS